jgi:hypothetical protein
MSAVRPYKKIFRNFPWAVAGIGEGVRQAERREIQPPSKERITQDMDDGQVHDEDEDQTEQDEDDRGLLMHLSPLKITMMMTSWRTRWSLQENMDTQ